MINDDNIEQVTTQLIDYISCATGEQLTVILRAIIADCDTPTCTLCMTYKFYIEEK